MATSYMVGVIRWPGLPEGNRSHPKRLAVSGMVALRSRSQDEVAHLNGA